MWVIAKHRAEEAKKAYKVEYYNIPKGGAPVWFDVMAIPKEAKNKEAALEWINYIETPQVHAAITNEVYYPSANTEARSAGAGQQIMSYQQSSAVSTGPGNQSGQSGQSASIGRRPEPGLRDPEWAADNFVRIVDIVKKFDKTIVVKGVNLSVKKGELFALLGSSGCGKSTHAAHVRGAGVGHLRPDRDRRRGSCEHAAVLQTGEYDVPVICAVPHMTVESNVAFGLKQEGVRGAELKERVHTTLELVQMAKYAQRKPHQLSDGQQQRVALARSLVRRPKLLLLDEPMSALDKQIRQRTQIELVNILDKVGVTCIMVTHDQEEVMTGRSDRGHERGRDRADRHAARGLRISEQPVHRRIHRLDKLVRRHRGGRRTGSRVC